MINNSGYRLKSGFANWFSNQLDQSST